MSAIPRPALILGLAGLIPFLWGAASELLPALAAFGTLDGVPGRLELVGLLLHLLGLLQTALDLLGTLVQHGVQPRPAAVDGHNAGEVGFDESDSGQFSRGHMILQLEYSEFVHGQP